MIKVISVAAMIAGMATSSFAGSATYEAPAEVNNDVFVATPSSAGLGLPLAIGAGVVAIGLIAGANDNDTPATDTSDAD